MDEYRNYKCRLLQNAITVACQMDKVIEKIPRDKQALREIRAFMLVWKNLLQDGIEAAESQSNEGGKDESQKSSET